MTKDIDKYWDKYKSIYSFEEFSAIYRELELLKSVSFRKNVIEIDVDLNLVYSYERIFQLYCYRTWQKPFEAITDLSKELKT